MPERDFERIMAKMMFVSNLDTPSINIISTTDALATPIAEGIPIATNTETASHTRQSTQLSCVDASHRKNIESQVYEQEITDRCTSARRNTGCVAEWQQNRRVRLREYQL